MSSCCCYFYYMLPLYGGQHATMSKRLSNKWIIFTIDIYGYNNKHLIECFNRLELQLVKERTISPYRKVISHSILTQSCHNSDINAIQFNCFCWSRHFETPWKWAHQVHQQTKKQKKKKNKTMVVIFRLIFAFYYFFRIFSIFSCHFVLILFLWYFQFALLLCF